MANFVKADFERIFVIPLSNKDNSYIIFEPRYSDYNGSLNYTDTEDELNYYSEFDGIILFDQIKYNIDIKKSLCSN